jgi:hypothetical protein
MGRIGDNLTLQARRRYRDASWPADSLRMQAWRQAGRGARFTGGRNLF